jgi:hypothetical protein
VIDDHTVYYQPAPIGSSTHTIRDGYLGMLDWRDDNKVDMKIFAPNKRKGYRLEFKHREDLLAFKLKFGV